MISSVSGRYVDCFHIANTHPLGGVDVPFWGLGPMTFDLILNLLL